MGFAVYSSEWVAFVVVVVALVVMAAREAEGRRLDLNDCSLALVALGSVGLVLRCCVPSPWSSCST